jgi:outer membrane protein assembly factor BamD
MTPTRWILVVLLGATTACAGRREVIPPGVPDPDRLLFERATAALKEERWFTARNFFRQIIDNYPQSTYRAEAKLGIGDSYLGENTAESLVLAAGEYREFLTFYPTHPRADYAQYQLAMSYFRQMLGPDRDQTNTREAIREFETFIERYPNSPLMNEARTRLREARDRLSESEFRVGLFYYRTGWYPGAIERFKGVLHTDPDFTRRDRVYYYLAEALLKMNQKAEALPYYERLVKEFGHSEFVKEAQKRIAELKAS